MAIATTDPSTGETIRTFDPLTEDQLGMRIIASSHAFTHWRDTPMDRRAALFRDLAALLDEEAEELGRIATQEVGKTLASAVAEVHKCAKGCRYYADNAEAMLADQPHDVPGARVVTRYEPLGPVLAVMPWNFPYWQVFRFAAPALMAGNTGLLKHASNVPQCALAIEDAFVRAGFPEKVFQTLLVGSSEIERIIGDDRVRAVTLTGSEAAGRAVAAAAGKEIKTSVLELGGSDPFVVMPSADLDEAVRNAVASRTLNNGQSCINAKRFIVHTDIADEFTRRLGEAMAALTVGDPRDEDTDVGPLSSGDAVKTLDQQVRDTVAAGATLVTGGEPGGGPGFYYPPTVLADIPDGSPAHREELFGPVASVWRARDLDDAIRIANDSTFGLGGSVWTTDPDEQQRLVRGIETGMIYVNRMTESTPEVPFGGTKNSGYGRELAQFGPRTFVNAKTVWIEGG
ncbi:NAD-dependent succinate-semialdehyde dehydrogenase [Pseudonocardia lutea]|jgi:succinate-semialdehyde dehydrogenase/glutarate-semialdehyde dehydrogenase|uniref:NAD-dependent succinate-semialdehyde dehydrogenase n=1 Tax=Pseudonocardia lutea TaxID=2172015 RepID=A0ABW1I2W9_9PSEU